MTGALRGTRLAAEVKLALIGAITEAKETGFSIVRSCEVLMLETRRFHRWVDGRDPKTLSIPDVTDMPPVPKTTPHQITETERSAIVAAARDEENSKLHHRKLAHQLSRAATAFVSESTVLKVLRSAQLLCRYQGRGRPKTNKPETEVSATNEMWAWDISYCRVGDGFWYLIAIIDMFSHKIVGHAVRPSATSDDVKDVFDKALANEGLLAMGAKMPKSLSDRGPQMRSKTIRRFFVDLGITQMFARPRTPADNATIESFFATIKGERLYRADCSNPMKLADDADAFVIYYNEERLHMGIDFVTPAEKHDKRADDIIAARRAGMKQARQLRLQVNRGCSEGSDAA
ncbi:MAG: IS3 family transposase [Actinobacteria bacterium]|nr:IS3 family transposase [Actinomycetota bacterium]